MRLKCFALYCELTNALPAFRGAHYSPKARNAQQVLPLSLPLVAVLAVVAVVIAAAVAKANMRALGIVPQSADSSSLWQDNALIAPVCAAPPPPYSALSSLAPLPPSSPFALALPASPSCVLFSACMSLRLRVRRRLAV